VEKESAILDYENRPAPLPVDTNHIDMARTRTDEIASSILTMALNATRDRQTRESELPSTKPRSTATPAVAANQESEAAVSDVLQPVRPLVPLANMESQQLVHMPHTAIMLASS